MSSSANEAAVPEIDTSRPHAARVYDYYLGGKDNFAADREMAEKAQASWPTIRTSARENRAFLGRAVRYLTGQVGIRQFLDIGAGLPSADNVHEVAQGTAPSCRIVYVDNDPLVLTHARALLTSGPEGRTAYIHADLRDPAGILAHPVTRDVLDFTQPIALMLVGVLHLVPDEDNPADIMTTLLDALPPGSYLTASNGTAEFAPEETGGAVRAFREAGVPFQPRDSGDFARLAFTGLELVPPGVVVTSEWRPEGDGPRPMPAEVNTYGGVARKPSLSFPSGLSLHPTTGLTPAGVHLAVTALNHICNRAAALSRQGQGGERARMSLWKIRIAMSDDPRSQGLLTQALAGQRVCSRLLSPHDAQTSVDVIIDLTDVAGLGSLLGELHMISPQVFVSSADQPSPLATA